MSDAFADFFPDLFRVLGNPNVSGAFGAFSLVLALCSFVGGWYSNVQKEASKRKQQACLRALRAEEDERVRLEQDRLRKNERWHASQVLLRQTILHDLPGEFRERVIEGILERLCAETQIQELFRATRFAVELLLLDGARSRTPRLLINGRGEDDALSQLEPTISEILTCLKNQVFVQEPAIREFDTCLELGNLAASKPTAQNYFEALADLRKEHSWIGQIDRFLTRISVRRGFAAPLYLLRGLLLLPQINENWQLALDHYSATLTVTGADAQHEELRLVQNFEFFCWLLWGPSIPMCSCKRWAGSFAIAQFGYGDEAESFPLVLEDAGDSLELPLFEASKRSSLPIARACTFDGEIIWGPEYCARDSVQIPQILSRGAPTDYENFALDGIALKVAQKLRADNSERGLYYSAYLWVMFEICGADGRPIPAYQGRQRWRSLLPIFEHCNAADATSLRFLKDRLAEKALAAVHLLEKGSNGERWLRYVCAVDDSGGVFDRHGEHRARSTEPRGDLLRNKRKVTDTVPLLFEVEPDGDRICDIMIRRISDSVVRERLFGVHKDLDFILTSCDLPNVIEEFYAAFLSGKMR